MTHPYYAAPFDQQLITSLDFRLLTYWEFTGIIAIAAVAQDRGWQAWELAGVANRALVRHPELKPEAAAAYAWRAFTEEAHNAPPPAPGTSAIESAPCDDPACNGYGWHNYAARTGPKAATQPNPYAIKCPTGRLAALAAQADPPPTTPRQVEPEPERPRFY